MKQIQLTQGKTAIVDDADYEILMQYKWWALRSVLSDHIFYAMTRLNGRITSMHVALMKSPKGFEVDHIDGDGLNNLRSNLRLVTKSQQRMNQKIYKNNHSGFKGVFAERGRWRAVISVNKKLIHLGYFDEKLDAARHYNSAAQKHFGEFARLNAIQ